MLEESRATIVEEYVGLKGYDELLRDCDNCGSFECSEYSAFVETLIRGDKSPMFPA